MQAIVIKTAIAAVITLVLMTSSLFIVPQTSQALVLQFGEIKRVVKTPGLHVKVPFIQDLLMFDKRILEFETKPAEFISKNRETGVDERVVIDAFVRYKIIDPVQFYQAVKNEANLNNRLTSVVLSSMRRVLAAHSLSDLLSTSRATIMKQIQVNVNAQVSAAAGVVDVRIVRAELPADISQSTYERMRKNFTKEAQRFRAEGEEKATEIRATAERERTELLAEARKTAEITRGEGDAIATKTYAEAFGRDPAFFKFYRSMQAYRSTLSKDDTSVILSPSDGFLDEFRQ